MTPPHVNSLICNDHPPEDTFRFERAYQQQGFRAVAGVDEAGRGPLAGPVVAGCVVLDHANEWACFQDSKKITAKRRDILFDLLQHNGARIGVGIVDPREIETLNILQASLEAMRRAWVDCTSRVTEALPDYLLVDGTFEIPIDIPQTTLVKGESKSASIAAASIIAKVTRDRLMAKAHALYPEYGFAKHQGYPTKAHREALRLYGPCPIHRRTFRGVKEFLTGTKREGTLQQPGLWSKSDLSN